MGRIAFLTTLLLSWGQCSEAAISQDAPRKCDEAQLFYGFGRSVSAIADISGDGVPDVLVGCPDSRAEELRKGNGAVFAFSGSDGALLMSLIGREPRASFGASVADAGDVDEDGVNDIVVGAPFACPGGYASKRGEALVFSGRDGHPVMSAIGRAPNDRFAWCVSAAGDWNRDGRADILVGSPWASSGESAEEGSVQVLSGADGKVLFEQRGAAPGEWVGFSVGSADLDGDGYADCVAGAPGHFAGNGGKVGRVVAYSGRTGKEMLSAVGTIPDGKLGFSVCVGGDLDGDNGPDVIAGAPLAGIGKRREVGRVLGILGRDGTLLFSLDGPDGVFRYGWCLAVLGCEGERGGQTLVVGSPCTPPEEKETPGRLQFLSMKGLAPVRDLHGDKDGDWFGQSMARISDLNRDGVDDLIVGAEYAVGGVGRVHVVSGKDGSRMRVLAPPTDRK